jgi:hypothetical protein
VGKVVGNEVDRMEDERLGSGVGRGVTGIAGISTGLPVSETKGKGLSVVLMREIGIAVGGEVGEGVTDGMTREEGRKVSTPINKTS